MRAGSVAACGLALAMALPALAWAQASVPKVDVMHWWVSQGEQASIDVIRRYVRQAGMAWQEEARPGSGTARYGDFVRQRVEAGRPPAAAQMIGFDIHYWARRGALASLDEQARVQEWDEVVPYGIQRLSKYQGHWIAAPINAHATNWLWVNKSVLDRLGGAAPDNWDALIALLEKAKAAGVVPLAIGKEAWEQTLLFESVAAGAGGAEFYRRAFLDLDPQALQPQLLRTIFQRMRQLRAFADAGLAGRTWDQATRMVMAGQALLQVQGTWVNGEFTSRRMVPGRQFACFLFPDTQGIYLFNADQYVFFQGAAMADATRGRFAATLMDTGLQRDLNIATGAAPARVDVALEPFNACGQQLIRHLRASNMRRTVLGSVAMGNANPPAVKTAIYQLVHAHFTGAIDDETAIARLQAAISGPASE